MWTNTIKLLKENLNKTKPCHILGWCPYGCIVEEFSLDEEEIDGVKINCNLFGHHCPMYYNAEDVSEERKDEVMQKIMKARGGK